MQLIHGTRQNDPAVSWRQFTNRSLKSVIHWRQMGTHFLLTPKDLPQHCHRCAHNWWHSKLNLVLCITLTTHGEEPTTKVELLKYCLSLPTSHGLIDKKLHPDSFQPCNYFSKALAHLGNNTGCLCKSRQIAVHVCSRWWIPQRCCKTQRFENYTAHKEGSLSFVQE